MSTITALGALIGSISLSGSIIAWAKLDGRINKPFALLFGVLMTTPIGGADMPVVISLYNAFTGLAVGLEGFVIQNPALMIAGMVVGSAGTLLTLLMAKAMNRSVSNVLFSNFGEVSAEQQRDIKGRLKPARSSRRAGTAEAL